VRLSEAQLVQPRTSADAAAPAAAARARQASQAPDLRQEYRYVIADLRRIAIIAVVMLAALIVLALVLT
jgi:hypothetical protein